MRLDIEGVIKELGVHIKATHTNVGDLTVALVHPDGTSVTLRGREGDGEGQIDQIFGLGGTNLAALQRLIDKPSAGLWKVVVQDHEGQDVGTLDYVKITIRGYLN